MNLKLLLSILLTSLPVFPLFAQQTKFERSNGKETVTYAEGMAAFRALDSKYAQLQLIEYGLTDSGEPLHLMVASANKVFDPDKLKDKTIVMVMNAIHPGEPDGVDASLMLLRDLMTDKEKNKLLDEVVLVVIPFFNIGGALNRNSNSRANQNGPKAYGFRGNARNLDLNRDMVKAESRNAKSFQQMYHEWDPDIFLDNHVSNGADYQYVVTVIPTQEDKLGNGLGEHLRNKMMPYLYESMEKKGFPTSPYVNVFGR